MQQTITRERRERARASANVLPSTESFISISCLVTLVATYAYVLFSLYMFWTSIYSLCFALGLVHGWESKVEIYSSSEN